jgi:hypothetical protein
MDGASMAKYTREDLKKLSKETLLQFVFSFYRETNVNRKYQLTDILDERYSRFTLSNFEKEKKNVHIEWILSYQEMHPDDELEFCVSEDEIKRQYLMRKTQKDLMIMLVKNGYYCGTFEWDTKRSLISTILGKYPFSGKPQMLSDDQREAFLSVLENESLEKHNLNQELINLRRKYNLSEFDQYDSEAL